jgi:hypothetical protein
MTETLTQVALLLAIFLMMHLATPLFLIGTFIMTGHPDLVALIKRFRDLLRD